MMYQIPRTRLQAEFRHSSHAKEVELGGQTYATLGFSGSPPGFHATFDRVSEILMTLPRMYFEPDGSFAWTGTLDGNDWRIEGVMYDEGPRLSYIELSGNCPPNDFDQFLAAVGWPAAPVMFQLVEAGVYLAEKEFRRLASGE